MMTEAISIMVFVPGRWNTFVAKNPASEKEIMNKRMPKADSNSRPEATTFLISLVLSCDLYWARYFIMAEFIPQSLNIPNNVGDMNAMVYRPYSSSVSSVAMMNTATANIMVERLTPKKRLNPPLADTFAILTALLNNQFSQPTLFQFNP